jgi:catechol 2,3-dioxygenase-like lactoylglutathione lyase family enzyme
MLADAQVEANVPTANLERATEFYEGKLGLRRAGGTTPSGREVVYEAGGGTRLLVYERPTAGTAEHTLVHFIVSDVDAAVEGLRGKGVVFEEYDMPEIKTVDGILTMGDFKAAWFRDPDGNILGIHS